MRSELSAGRASVAAVWIGLQHDDEPDRALVRTEVGAEQPTEAHARRPRPAAPRRNRSTMASAERGSAASIGWVSESVSARSRRAASSGSIRSRCADRSNNATSAGLSGSGPWSACARLADLRHEPPDVDDAALGHLGRLDELPLERGAGVDVGERLLVGRRVDRGLERGGDQLVLVGEDVEDRPLRHAGSRGDLARGDRGAVLGQQRERGGDDRGPPLVRWQRCSTARPGEGGRSRSCSRRASVPD